MDVASCHLDGNADAVAFCPHNRFHHILAAATYTLEDGTQPHRSGSISLFSTDTKLGLELLHRVDTIGVFDIKWNPNSNGTQPLLAQADANGCVSLFRLESEPERLDGGTILRETCTERISSAMCLCLDWNPSADSVSLGLSDGSVSLVAIRESELQALHSWVAHDYELWATAYDFERPHLLYTGSDDCRFNCWDLRDSQSNLVFQNAKTHKMGVCCIAPDPMNTNLLLTGSYDEFLRIWDIRSTTQPVNERSLHLGGGVWRIKFHPHIKDLVLAACMHNGFAIVRTEQEDANVVETYDKHKSLAYGADWQRGVMPREDSLIATCSFYDKLLRIWLPESLMAQKV